MLRAPEGSAVVMVGEGMLALWAGLKRTLKPGDKVLSVATGIYGYGIADMCRGLGAVVEVVGTEYNETVSDTLLNELRTKAQAFKPKIITAVHCETPSGTLNDRLSEVGKISASVGSLFYVDFVSSGMGTPVNVADWHIDIGLLGSQKVLSLRPDLSILTVSSRAWAVIDEVDYKGYEALKGWKNVVAEKYCPYTHNWPSMIELNNALDAFSKEGLDNVFKRHNDVAAYCRERLEAMGLKLYVAKGSTPSPTITACYVPDGITWEEFNSKLRSEGVVVGGNYGKLKDKVFRVGHMGVQADKKMVTEALDKIQAIIKQIKL